MFEPPAELDRVVLRQAREAIETGRPLRVFRNPRWATPVALAATLVLAFTVLFYAGLPQTRSPVPEVTVQNVAERVDVAQEAVPAETAPAVAANNQRAGEDRSGDAVVVELKAPHGGQARGGRKRGAFAVRGAQRSPAPPRKTAAREPEVATASARCRRRRSDLAARCENLAGGDREIAQCGRYRARRR